MKPEFSRQIFEKYSLNFMKIRPVGADLICAGGRAGGQTDMTKLIVSFRSFANAPEKTPSKLRHQNCLLATSLNSVSREGG